MKKEVVIVGAGVVGLAMAAALAKLDLNIAVLDAGPIPDSNELLKADKDLRVYAFNQASQKLFRDIGAWQPLIEADLLSPYLHMHVWDANSDGKLLFHAQELGRQQLGHIVEERALKYALLSCLEKLDNVTLHGNRQLDSVDVQNEAVFLQTSKGDICTKLIIGADGANSWLRKTLNFTCKATPYPHHAIVCYVKTEQSHQQTAYQIFQQEGPLAFLPSPDQHQCSIVWSLPKEKAGEMMALSDEDFCQHLGETFQHKLGKLSESSQRVSFPLIERQVSPFIKPRVALIGDALHTIHPLAGLGMNLGLADVCALQVAIGQSPTEFDAFQTLRRYERSRKGEVKLLTTLMSLLSRAYSNKGIPPLLRSIGMNRISQSILLKSAIIKFAAGD